MEKEAKLGILFFLLLISILTLAFNIQTVRAIGTIYIRSDGSIDPPTAPIQRDGDMYILTDNITSSADNGIVIQRNNMTLDGADYTLQGSGGYLSIGIFLSGRSNVTIRNMEIMAFDTSIYLDWSSNNNISGNTVIGGFRTIMLYHSSSNIISGNYVDGGGSFRTGIHVQDSSNNIISENTVTNVSAEGIRLLIGATNNSVLRNTITNNSDGIWVESSNNTIAENNIVNNVYDGMVLSHGSLNNIYHNNFINNTFQVAVLSGGENFFDDGYPSGGNYWSDYTDVDLFSGPGQNEPGSDGIWDNPYTIDEDNEDRYPLVEPYSVLHDVAVTSIGFHHSTVYGNITVTTTYNGENVNLIYVDAEISNHGDAPETVETTFTYTIANVPTTIGVVFVDVAAGGTEIASVSLNTSGFPVGYLPITVEATEVLNEGNTLNNNMTTTLWIKQVGDVQGDPSDPDPLLGDGDVDRYDSGAMAMAYGWHYGEPRYNVEADFDRDGVADRYDGGYLAQNYGIILPPYEPL